MYEQERELQPFAVDSATDPCRFSFCVKRELTPPAGECVHAADGIRVYQQRDCQIRYMGVVRNSWETAHIRVALRGKDHTVELLEDRFPGRIGTHIVLSCLGAEHLIAQVGGFVFHASYICWKDRGILFTAPSGTGKSTQAELWRTLRGAEIINGDRAALRVTDAGAVVEGIPFSGSSPDCKNQSLPLAAIVYLKQAPRTTIGKLQGAEAFRRIWEGVSVNTWDKKDVSMVADTVMQVVQKVPMFLLSCTPDETAVIALEEALKE